MYYCYNYFEKFRYYSGHISPRKKKKKEKKRREEMRDEKRDRGTERDRIRGQKRSDGGREQGKGKAPEGPWSGAGCPLFWPRGKELHRAGSYTLPRWYFNFLGARPSLPVPAGSSGCVSKGCCACHVTVSSGRWLLI